MVPVTEASLSLSFMPEFKFYDVKGSDTAVSLTITAPFLKDEESRAPLCVSSVLDKSGSMEGMKLDLVKKTMHFVTSQLTSVDALGVVLYDSTVEELFPLLLVDQKFKDGSKPLINKIAAGTCTNLSGGLFKGIEQQQRNKCYIWGTHPSFLSAPAADPQGEEEEEQSQGKGFFGRIFGGKKKAQQPKRTPVSHPLFTSSPPATLPLPPAPPVTIPPPPAPLAAAPSPSPQAALPPTEDFIEVEADQAQPPSPPASPPPAPAPSSSTTSEVAIPSDAVRSLFILTDGLANEGVTDVASLTKMLTKMLDHAVRPRIYTFGFGADHNPNFLGDLATAGGGAYYYIEDEDKIPTAFADALGGLMSVVLQNIEVVLTPHNGCIIKKVHGVTTKPGPTPGSLVVSLPDLYTEERRSLLLDVALPNGPVEEKFTLVEATVKALDVNLAAFVERSAKVEVSRVKTLPADREPSNEVVEQIERVRAAEAMETAQRLASQGNLGGAREELNQVLVRVAAAPGFQASPVLQAVVRDATIAMGGMTDERTYREKGEKRLTQAKTATANQRAAYAEDEAEMQAMYSVACEKMADMTFAPSNGAPPPPCAAPAPAMLSSAVFSGGNIRKAEMKKAAKQF